MSTRARMRRARNGVQCDESHPLTCEALMKLRSALFAGLTLALFANAAADAAEIKIMAPRAVWTVLNVAGPEFERATGTKLNVSVHLAAGVVRRGQDGGGCGPVGGGGAPLA